MVLQTHWRFLPTSILEPGVCTKVLTLKLACLCLNISKKNENRNQCLYRPLIVYIVLVSLFRFEFIAISMSVLLLFDPIFDVLLLIMHDVHGFVSVVKVVPSGTLMWRITCPYHSPVIHILHLGPPNAPIRPGTCAHVSSLLTLAGEAVHDCADDSLYDFSKC